MGVHEEGKVVAEGKGKAAEPRGAEEERVAVGVVVADEGEEVEEADFEEGGVDAEGHVGESGEGNQLGKE